MSVLSKLKKGFVPLDASLASQATGAAAHTSWIIMFSALFLGAGVTAPIVEIKRFIFFTEPVSILGGIGMLIREGEYLIALIVIVFSVIFPAAKIHYTEKLWRRTPADSDGIKTALERLEFLGKWSMLDVFVIGLIVFSVKATGIADATSQLGLYFFVLAIALSMLSVHLVKGYADRVIVRATGKTEGL